MFNRKKWLIRGLPDKVLIYLLKRLAHNTAARSIFLREQPPGVNEGELTAALANEFLSRPIAATAHATRHQAMSLSGLPCEYCHRTGLYIVSGRLRCRVHQRHAQAARIRLGKRIDDAQVGPKDYIEPARTPRLYGYPARSDKKPIP